MSFGNELSFVGEFDEIGAFRVCEELVSRAFRGIGFFVFD